MTRVPQLTMKVWDGDALERFRHRDMNRICYNANVVAELCGVRTATFPEVVRSDQFRYDYAQILEEMTSECAEALGIDMTVETAWGPGRVLSYVDFERWESNLFRIYTALGGIGDRIPAERRRLTYSATLFAGDWLGSGPWYQELHMPAVFADRDMVAFVPHTATAIQRAAEASALMRAETVSDRRVRITATGRRPRTNLPLRVALGGLDMQEMKTLSASGWTGTGPWYQSVTLSQDVVDAVVGVTEGTTDAQVQEFGAAGIAPSSVSGSTLTLRAIYGRPEMDILVGVMYDADDTEAV